MGFSWRPPLAGLATVSGLSARSCPALLGPLGGYAGRAPSGLVEEGDAERRSELETIGRRLPRGTRRPEQRPDGRQEPERERESERGGPRGRRDRELDPQRDRDRDLRRGRDLDWDGAWEREQDQYQELGQETEGTPRPELGSSRRKPGAGRRRGGGGGSGGSGLPARLCHGAIRSCLPDGADTKTFPALASRFGQLVLLPWVGLWVVVVGAFFSDPSRAPAHLFPPQEPPFTHKEVSHEPIQASFFPRCWATGVSSGLGRGGRISLPM